MTFAPKVARPTKAEERDAYELVTVRDRDCCVRCRGVDPLFGVNRDHRRGRSLGGYTVPSNLQLLCGSGTTGCHGWRTENPNQAANEGYAVPSWVHWREWPARRWIDGRQVWVLYDDEGGWREITDAEARQRIDEGLVPF
jgi:hypothetical protein